MNKKHFYIKLNITILSTAQYEIINAETLKFEKRLIKKNSLSALIKKRFDKKE